jgi:hypothetical protein
MARSHTPDTTKSTETNCRLRTLFASNNIAREAPPVFIALALPRRQWKWSDLWLGRDKALVTRVSMRHKSARDVALLRVCLGQAWLERPARASWEILDT